MILCLGTTPAAQRVMIFRRLTLDAVNRATTTLDGIAGKSVNVAKVLHALGEHPLATGFLGGERGARIRETLDARGIASEFVEVNAPTRQCVTLIDEGSGTVTELVEESRAVDAPAAARLLAMLERRIPASRAVVMSGTLAPGVAPDLYRRCTDWAHAAGSLSVVDAQGAPLLEALAARPEVVKPNRSELAATAGRELPDEAALCGAMRELAERGAARVVVTAGAGATLAFDGRKFWRVRSPAVQAVNPIGSGDAFTAGLAAGLLRGLDLGESCRLGAAAGTANALQVLAGEVQAGLVPALAARVEITALPT